MKKETGDVKLCELCKEPTDPKECAWYKHPDGPGRGWVHDTCIHQLVVKTKSE